MAAIVTAPEYQAHTNQTFTGSALTSLTHICRMVDAAIRRNIAPFHPEPTTVTNQILDAPMGNELYLPIVPVRSITTLYLRWGANGESAAFTSDDLLTVNDDYYMPIDDAIRNYSRHGKVYRRGAGIWGYELHRHLGRLSNTPRPNVGAIKITYTAGPLSVPDDLVMAADLMVSLILQRRTTGVPYASESWNGYSASIPQQFLTSALASPDVQEILGRYQTIHVA